MIRDDIVKNKKNHCLSEEELQSLIELQQIETNFNKLAEIRRNIKDDLLLDKVVFQPVSEYYEKS